MSKSKIYEVGSTVKLTAKYVCVPCGQIRKFKAGDKFTECVSCLTNKKYKNNPGIWEIFSNKNRND